MHYLYTSEIKGCAYLKEQQKKKKVSIREEVCTLQIDVWDIGSTDFKDLWTSDLKADIINENRRIKIKNPTYKLLVGIS